MRVKNSKEGFLDIKGMIPLRVISFWFVVFILIMEILVIQNSESNFNTSISFEDYHVDSKMAHFFKHMGSTHMAQNYSRTMDSVSAHAPLFELDSKLNPVFLEHGELNVKCVYGVSMILRCYYTGVVKEPKYYILEVVFNNSVPDIMRFHVDLFNHYQPPQNYTSTDVYSKFAAYLFIFENLPGQVHRYPTLESISETSDFRKIRDRLTIVYQTVITSTFISNYLLWTLMLFHVLILHVILVIRILVVYLDTKRGGHYRKPSKKYLIRLRRFSAFHLGFTFISFMVHCLNVLLNGIAQSFLFSSLTEGITFKSTVCRTEGISIIGYFFFLIILLITLIAFHVVTFKDATVLLFKSHEEIQEENYPSFNNSEIKGGTLKNNNSIDTDDSKEPGETM